MFANTAKLANEIRAAANRVVSVRDFVHLRLQLRRDERAAEASEKSGGVGQAFVGGKACVFHKIFAGACEVLAFEFCDDFRGSDVALQFDDAGIAVAENDDARRPRERFFFFHVRERHDDDEIADFAEVRDRAV